MKKRLCRLILVIAVLMMAASPAYATGERSLSLHSIYYVPGKDVVFTFTAQGHFKASELTGYVWVSGQRFEISCHYNNNDDVKCTANQRLFRYIGLLASGDVAGFPFSGLILGPKYRTYCPTIWQASANGWVATPGPCTLQKPGIGDWILLDDGSIAFYNANGPSGPGFYAEPSLP